MEARALRALATAWGYIEPGQRIPTAVPDRVVEDWVRAGVAVMDQEMLPIDVPPAAPEPRKMKANGTTPQTRRGPGKKVGTK